MSNSLCAMAAIAEYWVLDLVNRILVVHREPNPAESTDSSVTTYAEFDRCSPLLNPTGSVLVGEMLPTVMTTGLHHRPIKPGHKFAHREEFAELEATDTYPKRPQSGSIRSENRLLQELATACMLRASSL